MRAAERTRWIVADAAVDSFGMWLVHVAHGNERLPSPNAVTNTLTAFHSLSQPFTAFHTLSPTISPALVLIDDLNTIVCC